MRTDQILAYCKNVGKNQSAVGNEVAIYEFISKLAFIVMPLSKVVNNQTNNRFIYCRYQIQPRKDTEQALANAEFDPFAGRNTANATT